VLQGQPAESNKESTTEDSETLVGHSHAPGFSVDEPANDLQCCKGKVIILVFIVLIVGRFIYGEARRMGMSNH
jgi:hypothetical protein